jgi:hypothetical protein
VIRYSSRWLSSCCMMVLSTGLIPCPGTAETGQCPFTLGKQSLQHDFELRLWREYLEPILKVSQCLSKGDEAAGEVQEAAVVRANPFPANQHTTEAVVPGVGALHHPAAGLALHAAEERLLAPAPDVGHDPASPDGRLGVLVVVPLLEAEVLRAARSARGAEDHCIERLPDEPLVVDVRAGDLGGQGHAAAVRQDVAFDAAFRPIRGVGAREAPPFGALAMALSSEDHFHWMPRLRS